MSAEMLGDQIHCIPQNESLQLSQRGPEFQQGRLERAQKLNKQIENGEAEIRQTITQAENCIGDLKREAAAKKGEVWHFLDSLLKELEAVRTRLSQHIDYVLEQCLAQFQANRKQLDYALDVLHDASQALAQLVCLQPAREDSQAEMDYDSLLDYLENEVKVEASHPKPSVTPGLLMLPDPAVVRKVLSHLNLTSADPRYRPVPLPPPYSLSQHDSTQYSSYQHACALQSSSEFHSPINALPKNATSSPSSSQQLRGTDSSEARPSAYVPAADSHGLCNNNSAMDQENNGSNVFFANPCQIPASQPDSRCKELVTLQSTPQATHSTFSFAPNKQQLLQGQHQHQQQQEQQQQRQSPCRATLCTTTSFVSCTQVPLSSTIPLRSEAKSLVTGSEPSSAGVTFLALDEERIASNAGNTRKNAVTFMTESSLPQEQHVGAEHFTPVSDDRQNISDNSCRIYCCPTINSRACRYCTAMSPPRPMSPFVQRNDLTSYRAGCVQPPPPSSSRYDPNEGFNPATGTWDSSSTYASDMRMQNALPFITYSPPVMTPVVDRVSVTRPSQIKLMIPRSDSSPIKIMIVPLEDEQEACTGAPAEEYAWDAPTCKADDNPFKEFGAAQVCDLFTCTSPSAQRMDATVQSYSIVPAGPVTSQSFLSQTTQAFTPAASNACCCVTPVERFTQTEMSDYGHGGSHLASLRHSSSSCAQCALFATAQNTEWACECEPVITELKAPITCKTTGQQICGSELKPNAEDWSHDEAETEVTMQAINARQRPVNLWKIDEITCVSPNEGIIKITPMGEDSAATKERPIPVRFRECNDALRSRSKKMLSPNPKAPCSESPCKKGPSWDPITESSRRCYSTPTSIYLQAAPNHMHSTSCQSHIIAPNRIVHDECQATRTLRSNVQRVNSKPTPVTCRLVQEGNCYVLCYSPICSGSESEASRSVCESPKSPRMMDCLPATTTCCDCTCRKVNKERDTEKEKPPTEKKQLEGKHSKSEFKKSTSVTSKPPKTETRICFCMPKSIRNPPAQTTEEESACEESGHTCTPHVNSSGSTVQLQECEQRQRLCFASGGYHTVVTRKPLQGMQPSCDRVMCARVRGADFAVTMRPRWDMGLPVWCECQGDMLDDAMGSGMGSPCKCKNTQARSTNFCSLGTQMTCNDYAQTQPRKCACRCIQTNDPLQTKVSFAEVSEEENTETESNSEEKLSATRAKKGRPGKAKRKKGHMSSSSSSKEGKIASKARTQKGKKNRPTNKGRKKAANKSSPGSSRNNSSSSNNRAVWIEERELRNNSAKVARTYSVKTENKQRAAKFGATRLITNTLSTRHCDRSKESLRTEAHPRGGTKRPGTTDTKRMPKANLTQDEKDSSPSLRNTKTTDLEVKACSRKKITPSDNSVLNTDTFAGKCRWTEVFLIPSDVSVSHPRKRRHVPEIHVIGPSSDQCSSAETSVRYDPVIELKKCSDEQYRRAAKPSSSCSSTDVTLEGNARHKTRVFFSRVKGSGVDRVPGFSSGKKRPGEGRKTPDAKPISQSGALQEREKPPYIAKSPPPYFETLKQARVANKQSKTTPKRLASSCSQNSGQGGTPVSSRSPSAGDGSFLQTSFDWRKSPSAPPRSPRQPSGLSRRRPGSGCSTGPRSNRSSSPTTGHGEQHQSSLNKGGRLLDANTRPRLRRRREKYTLESLSESSSPSSAHKSMRNCQKLRKKRIAPRKLPIKQTILHLVQSSSSEGLETLTF